MTFIKYLLESYLMEDVIDDVSKDSNVPREMVQHYYDHALDKSDKSQRALQFVVGLHKKGAIVPEHASDIKPHMATIARANLKGKLKSVNTLDDLHALTEPHMDKAVSKKERIDNDSPVVFENDHIKVIHHKTHESAIKAAALPAESPCHSGLNGKAAWCVSAASNEGAGHFDRYTKNGKQLYTILNKKTNRKHALIIDHDTTLSDMELRDEHDRSVTGVHGDPVYLHHFVSSHPGLEHSEVEKMFNNISATYVDLKKDLPLNPSHKEVQDALASPKWTPTTNYARHAALLSRHVSSEQLDHELENHSNSGSPYAAANENATPKQLDKALDSWSPATRANAAGNPNASFDNIQRAIEDKKPEVVEAALSSKHVTKQNLSSVLSRPTGGYENDLVKVQALHHALIDNDHLDTALKGYSEVVKMAAITHPKINAAQLQNVATNTNKKLAIVAVEHKKANADVIHHGLSNIHTEVRVAAIKNPNATHRNIDKALDDKDPAVRLYAASHPNSTKEHVEKALHDENDMVRLTASTTKTERGW